MKLELILLEKNRENFIKEGMDYYSAKIVHYCPLEIITIHIPKNVRKYQVPEQKKQEAYYMKKFFSNPAIHVLLDEKGKKMNSMDFSLQLNRWFGTSAKRICFFIGGPFGVDESFKKKFNFILSLSHMTFSHQLIRILFLEQLYRALTLRKGEKYHHE